MNLSNVSRTSGGRDPVMTSAPLGRRCPHHEQSYSVARVAGQDHPPLASLPDNPREHRLDLPVASRREYLLGAREWEQRLEVLDGREDELELAGGVSLERLCRPDPGGLRDLLAVRPGWRVGGREGHVEAGVKPHRDEFRRDPSRPGDELRVARELDARLLLQ